MKKRIVSVSIIMIISAAMLMFAGGCGEVPTKENTPGEIEAKGAVTAEEAVAQAVLDRVTGGECTGEGHIILRETEEDGNRVIYAICSTGSYGFVNGNLEEIGGSGAIPTRLTFTVGEDGIWQLSEYWTPEDGSEYEPSLRDNYPLDLVSEALNAHRQYNKLKSQKEKYAYEYLDRIGRTAEVGDFGDFRHPLATDRGMSVEASNFLTGQEELGNYPLFIGTEEWIEDGVRWVYSNEWNPAEGGGTAVYTKTNYETGEVAEKWVFQINGDTCTLIEADKN